jgi:hypothetical protein
MIRKFTALLAAFAFAAVSLAPVSADARDRRGHGGYYDRGYGGHYGRRHHDDNGDEIAAGVLGLVLGVAVGSMLAQPREPRVQCYDNYRRCPPPAPPPGYYDRRGYEEQGYDPRYEGDYSAYEREYGLRGGPGEGDYDPYVERAPECTRQERQWDRYANRYVIVDVPC